MSNEPKTGMDAESVVQRMTEAMVERGIYGSCVTAKECARASLIASGLLEEVEKLRAVIAFLGKPGSASTSEKQQIAEQALAPATQPQPDRRFYECH